MAPTSDARKVTNGLEVGRALIERVARRDLGGAAELFTNPLNFRGLTPGSFREATTPAEAVAILEKWFYEDDDVIGSVEWCDGRPVGRDGRFKLSYGYRAKSTGMQEWYDEHGLEGAGGGRGLDRRTGGVLRRRRRADQLDDRPLRRIPPRLPGSSVNVTIASPPPASVVRRFDQLHPEA